LRAFCTSLRDDLRVTNRECWIEAFESFVTQQKGERFPVTPDKFHAFTQEFAASSRSDWQTWSSALWLRSGQIKASVLHFVIDLRNWGDAAESLVHMENWDKYVLAYNVQASRFARGAWHTSDQWVRAEAQMRLISSTVETLAVANTMAFLGMVAFTWNCILASVVVLMTVMVVAWLAFFIVVCMGWLIGPVEVISLIVFIGYATTYSLHIAHMYGQPGATKGAVPACVSGDAATRFRRTNYALKSMGSAAFGSAVSTAGCACFLVACRLVLFQKLGAVVLVVTLYSIFAALGPLPAILMIMGPRRPFCSGSNADGQQEAAAGVDSGNFVGRARLECLEAVQEVTARIPVMSRSQGAQDTS